ncbi:helix-turn-helix transcriptional regulator [Microbacterium sp.]|uniref:helix-turn-helix transcriptional regulator n=1 Tax=Microbacterium sp. TaxID=51671 RepID=UPI0037C823B3
MTPLVANRAAALALLGDPIRRALYRLAAEGDLTRDGASAALGIPRSTAAVNLDRLTDAGLLVAEFRRLTGRSGPGAGRPAKVYRVATTELVASIPERHYELAAELLAAALERAERDRMPVREAVAEEAFATGAAVGGGHDTLEDALDACGYAPAAGGEGDLVLENCPFHQLATRHTPLVCGANVELVRGLAAATGDDREPVLAPREGRCCVEIRARKDAAEQRRSARYPAQ